MLISWLKPFYTEDDGLPQGGDEKPRVTDVLDRYGRDALKLADKLTEALADNYTLREKNRALRTERDDLKGKQAPDGAIVLTKEEGETWEAYKALGDPGMLKQSLEGAAQATQEAQTLKREKVVSEAAQAHGYKAGVLARLAGDLDLTMKTEGSGKDKKSVAYVVKDGKETALTAYADQEWTDFLPSLQQTSTGDGVGSPAQGKRAPSQIEVPSPRIRI